ncbi:putative signal recognition particle subunit SRP68-like isoform X1 [Capsicum annuum]|uniref:Major facilitator superfamily (MFS) profile domain-containing protein n=1 Tax=Capsicum annuum TaxID=4072 RepID=A0A2G3A9R4_CAPAN|nr:putative signal recognition particle subunit SRP68-like isoform X1 [Capsicum annuum]KAF3637606.1 putative signal recognition particle subunit SRP68-like isoform X1 [Capsicum annuum]PHT90913.1 hypothetical protein T459_06026 [Capsicum annuum]
MEKDIVEYPTKEENMEKDDSVENPTKVNGYACACAIVGSMISIIFGYGATSDAIGRRNTMIIASIIFLLGSVLMGYGPNYITLLGGRCVAGVGVGVGVGFALMIAPVYSAEISSPKTRGFLTSLPEIGN